MVVEKVGGKTFYGALAKEVNEKKPISPLKLRLTHLAKQISKMGYIGALLVTISYLFSVIVIDNNFDMYLIRETFTNFPLMAGHLLHALTLSVTIIVVAVPEGCRQVRWRSNIRAKRYVSLSGATRDGSVFIFLNRKMYYF